MGAKGEMVAKAEAGGELPRRYQTEVAANVSNLIAGRYPFVARGNEVALADFGSVFGPGGVFDTFFKERMATARGYLHQSLALESRAPRASAAAPAWRSSRRPTASGRYTFRRQRSCRTVHFSLAPESLDSAGARGSRSISMASRRVPLRSPLAVDCVAGPPPGQATLLFEEGGGGGPSRSYQGPWALFHLLDDAVCNSPSRMCVTW